MLTRREVLAQYKTDPDEVMITDFGSMQGNPIYVPSLWDDACSGHSDETIEAFDGPVEIIFPTENDREEFPELTDVVAVGLWQDDAGFIHCETFESQTELDDYRTRLEQEALDAEASE